MATLTIDELGTARQAATRANKLGKFVYSIAKYLFCALSSLVPIAMFFIYKANSGLDRRWDRETRGWASETDWTTIWATWGIVIGAWMIYTFALAMIALVGAVAQAKAQSLEIQILQAQD
jgi:hypothetical protein